MNIKNWEKELKPVTKTFSIVDRDAQKIIEKFVNQYWKSLKPYIAEMVERIEKSNDLLRSTYQIASRNGLEVEWDNFKRVVMEELEKQHKIMYPKQLTAPKLGKGE